LNVRAKVKYFVFQLFSSEDNKKDIFAFFTVSKNDDKPNDDCSWMSLEQSQVVKAFAKISSKLQLSQDFMDNHHRIKPLEKRPLFSQLNMISMVFSDFAKTQDSFTGLHASDQEILLKNNSQLYIQYILARYFSADSGLDQISWMSQEAKPSKTTSVVNQISFEEFNRCTNLFQCAEAADHYSQLSGNIESFYPLTLQCTAMVANLLLFNTDELVKKNLVDAAKISELFEKATWLLKLGMESGSVASKTLAVESEMMSNFGPLIRTLIKMKTIFERSKCFN
jgi:hypothetical protein